MITQRPYFERDGTAIYLGDCNSLLPELQPETIDLILTDPPYGVAYQSAHRTRTPRFDEIAGDYWNQEFNRKWIESSSRLLVRNGALVLFASDHHLGHFRDLLALSGLNVKRSLVWRKNAWTSGDLDADFGHQTEFIVHAHNGRRKLQPPRESNVLAFDRVPPNNLVHPTEKPELLIMYLLRKFDGRSILDPFMGSGTTLLAARRLQRRAIGIELEERYCEIAARRLESQSATLGFDLSAPTIITETLSLFGDVGR